jgi:N,N'-diacetyllegionaminate synthase
MKKVRIADRWVGPGEPALVIAEAGSNHDRKLSQALQLIDVAADAGADVVKFQLFRGELLYPRSSPSAGILKGYELPREWLGDLADRAKRRNIMFTATPFDHEAVDLLCKLGAPFLKWASPEIHDVPLLRYAARRGVPIVVSTGMAELADVQAALAAMRAEGNDQAVVLQCSSLYPAAPQHVHLRMMDSLREAFDVPVGFSDHSTSLVIPVAAVARGACVVEKHFTVSRSLTGADHGFALEPGELTQMVAWIRDVEASLGDAAKHPLYGEENLPLNNKSLVSTRAIAKGTVIAADMLTVKRARTGIRPVLIDVVVGRKAARDIAEDEVLEWEAV